VLTLSRYITKPCGHIPFSKFGAGKADFSAVIPDLNPIQNHLYELEHQPARLQPTSVTEFNNSLEAEEEISDFRK